MTTKREAQSLKNPRMTTKRESQSPIIALDSETRVTAVDFFDFAISLCGNLSTLPLTVNHRKSQCFRAFSEPLFYFLDINTTVSTCESVSLENIMFSAYNPGIQRYSFVVVALYFSSSLPRRMRINFNDHTKGSFFLMEKTLLFKSESHFNYAS